MRRARRNRGLCSGSTWLSSWKAMRHAVMMRNAPKMISIHENRARRATPGMRLEAEELARRGEGQTGMEKKQTWIPVRGRGHGSVLHSENATLQRRTIADLVAGPSRPRSTRGDWERSRNRGEHRVLHTLKRILIGKPLPSNEEQHQRLSKRVGLAVFASDAISSTAYATEEILFVIFPIAGFVSLKYLVPIAWIVVVLLVIVATSYRQTIKAYPSGGGSYVVARENLGVWPSLVAGSSLLVDYVLTVAVSVSAGVAAIT